MFVKVFGMLVLMLYFFWGLYFIFTTLYLFAKQCIFSILKLNVFSKHYRKKVILKFNPKRYDSMFKSPLFLYPMVIVHGLIFLLLSSLFFPKISATEYWILIGPVSFLLYFWISVYVYYLIILKEREQILKVVHIHKKLIKVTALPLGLIGMVVPVISVINMLITTEFKNEMISNFMSIKITKDSMGIFMLVFATLLFEGISFLMASLVEHFYESEGSYIFYMTEVIRVFKSIF